MEYSNLINNSPGWNPGTLPGGEGVAFETGLAEGGGSQSSPAAARKGLVLRRFQDIDIRLAYNRGIVEG